MVRCRLLLLAGMAVPSAAAFDKLSRRHGIKVLADTQCSVEHCSLAMADVVGCESIISASRMNGAVVLFLDNIDKVNSVVANGIVINDTFTPVMPLVQPAKRITLSNVPPFIKDDTLERELSRHGKIMSKMKKVPIRCNSPSLQHVVSFRRHVYMILNNENEELNLVMKFKVENFDYVIYATSSMMKCFGCGKEGHTIRACPDKLIQSAAQDNVANKGTGAGVDRARNPEPAAENHGSEVVEMMDVNTTVNVDANTVVNLDVNTVVNDDVNNVVNAVVDIVSKGEGKDESIGLENYVAAVVAGVDGDDLDVAENESCFKTPAIKRKTNKRGKGKKAKKMADHNGLNVKEVEVDSETSCPDESAPGSESESSDSSVAVRRSGRTAYTLEKIKTFLQNTKGMKGVKVEGFFPDRQRFLDSAKILMKDTGEGGFTEQGIFR